MLEDELQRREYSIHNSSSYCLEAFERLQSSIKHSHPLSELISLPAIEDQIGRFRAWISHIGALKTDRSSLDFRLRDVTFLADNVVKLLETLYNTLSEVELITGGEATQSASPEEDYPNDDESNSSSDSNESEETSPPLPEVQQCYLLIVDVIDRLYKLSVIIRSRQLQNRSTKADNFVEKDEEGRDLTAAFESYAIVRAKHQMRAWKNITNEMGLEKDDEDLAIRIGKANSRRRRQFMYEQRHRRKFFSVQETKDDEQNKESPRNIGATEHPSTLIAKSPEFPASFLKSPASFRITTILSKRNSSQNSQQVEEVSDNTSTTSSSTTCSGYQTSDVSIPEAPENEFGKEFQCPYCYMILSAKMGKSDAWRKHVLKDLQPYMCIFKGCSTQDILYDSQDAWLRHEQWEHAYQWCCNFEGHPLAMFSEENGFKAHLENHHPENFETHQLQTLSDASKRPSFAAFSICPFCGASPEDLVKSDHDVSVQSDPQMNVKQADIKTRDSRFVTSKAVENLQRHVARHLRQSAMMALPSRDDLDNGKSASCTGYRQSKSDTFDMFDTSIDELKPSPFIETCEVSADIPFEDNTLLWQEVFAQIPGVRRGDLKLNEFMVQSLESTTPRAPPLDTNQSTSKGKGTDLSTEWSEWIWDNQGYWSSYRKDPTGDLEYKYRLPEPENQSAILRMPGSTGPNSTPNQQTTYDPTIELANPAYTTSQLDTIDSHVYGATPKSSFVYASWSNTYSSNMSSSSQYSSTSNTTASSNTSCAPSEDSAPSSTMTPNSYVKTLIKSFELYGGLTQDNFWKVGRVFMMLWTEPREGKLGDQVHSELRRFVVLIKSHGHSVCSPIHTYSIYAFLKGNLPASTSHAIIYTSQVCPKKHCRQISGGSLEYETLDKDPIRVDSQRDDINGQLGPLSRLNYSRLYVVKDYVSVLNIGMVAPESMDTFLRDSVLDDTTWTASSAQRPRSNLPPKRPSGRSPGHRTKHR